MASHLPCRRGAPVARATATAIIEATQSNHDALSRTIRRHSRSGTGTARRGSTGDARDPTLPLLPAPRGGLPVSSIFIGPPSDRATDDHRPTALHTTCTGRASSRLAAFDSDFGVSRHGRQCRNGNVHDARSSRSTCFSRSASADWDSTASRVFAVKTGTHIV